MITVREKQLQIVIFYYISPKTVTNREKRLQINLENAFKQNIDKSINIPNWKTL